MNKKLATLALVGVLTIGGTVGVYASTSNSHQVNAGSANQTQPAAVEQSKENNENDKELTLQNTKTAVTEEQAKKTALDSVTGSQFIDMELEDENGTIVYGVEIKTDKTSYDVKVDANTGAIIKSDQDNGNEKNSNENDSKVKESKDQDNDNVEHENQNDDEQGHED